MSKGLLILKGRWIYEIGVIGKDTFYVWPREGEIIDSVGLIKMTTESTLLVAFVKGTQPRCRYCKRRLVFHNNGEGADCLKQLTFDI